MLQEFVGIPHVDGVYWSLEVELVFYVWMLAMFALDGMRHMHRVIVAWLLVSMAAFVATALLDRTLPALPNRLLLLEHSPFFAIGAAAFVDFRAGRISRATWLVFAMAAATAWLSKGLQGLVVSLTMEVFFTLLVWRRAKFLDVRWLVFLGTVSYPLYLLHQNIGYVIIAELRALQVDYGWAMLAAMGVSLAAATLLTFGIERPCAASVSRVARAASRPSPCRIGRNAAAR
jgi:peptidoglycan/LPS O-acetylase OafA/YrhL